MSLPNSQTTLENTSYPKRWWLAIRPRTLPAAGSPVLIGFAIAWSVGKFRWLPALVILACALLLQILANLVNDVGDFQKGTDTSGRLGPTRVTHSGLLTPRQVWLGVGVVILLAVVGGAYLAWVGGWPVLVMGGAAILGAILYTIGPFSMSDYGTGDLFALIFFGVVSVVGTTYILTGQVYPLSWAGGVGAGALVTAILVVNNVRDIDTDRRVGRKNIPVLFGRHAGEIEYLIMLILAFCVPLFALTIDWVNAWILLPLLSLPRGVQLYQRIHTLQAGPGFNKLLASTAQLVLIYCLLFSIGVILGNKIIAVL
jgi:1,4-dihydroxy-2-naphthoate octaprenyltransferase